MVIRWRGGGGGSWNIHRGHEIYFLPPTYTHNSFILSVLFLFTFSPRTTGPDTAASSAGYSHAISGKTLFFYFHFLSSHPSNKLLLLLFFFTSIWVRGRHCRRRRRFYNRYVLVSPKNRGENRFADDLRPNDGRKKISYARVRRKRR